MRSGLSAVFALALLLASFLAPSAIADAAAPPFQGIQQTDAAANPFLILYPDLRQAAAPGWLRPGLRISYSFAFATFAQDPDDPTPAGSALLQYDVIAQDRRSVVVIPTSYSTEIQGQPPTALSYQVGLPGLGDFWFAPQVLAGA